MSASTDRSGLVTVVIPSYNHEKFIERAIRSVLEQTYRSVELVVIDDGSTDGSVNLLNRLRLVLPLTLITQENHGICHALNRAIREGSRGDYIAILGSDDFWHREKIERQVAALEGSPDAAFCYTQAMEFTDDNWPGIGRIFPRKVKYGSLLNWVIIRQHVPAGSMLFRRDLFETLGGFDEGLHEEDWDFVIRAAARTKFVAVSSPLLFYRVHAQSAMRARERRVIFQQKAAVLAKNFLLVSPWRWLAALLIHFLHDNLAVRLRSRRSTQSGTTAGVSRP